MNKEKFTLRQRWLPTLDEAAGLDNADGSTGLLQLIGRYTRSAALLGVLGWTGCQGIGNSIDYSQGERIGVVNKLSQKGLIWKTTEGQLSLEGRTSTGTQEGAGVWDFSLDRQAKHGENVGALKTKIAECMNQGKRTKLSYTEQGATWPWRSGTDNLVQNVECLETGEVKKP